MTNLEMLEIISKQFATVEDIQKLCGISKEKAYATMKDIYKGPCERYRTVPMHDVVKYFRINENRIIKYAKLEKELEKGELYEKQERKEA